MFQFFFFTAHFLFEFEKWKEGEFPLFQPMLLLLGGLIEKRYACKMFNLFYLYLKQNSFKGQITFTGIWEYHPEKWKNHPDFQGLEENSFASAFEHNSGQMYFVASLQEVEYKGLSGVNQLIKLSLQIQEITAPNLGRNMNANPKKYSPLFCIKM